MGRKLLNLDLTAINEAILIQRSLVMVMISMIIMIININIIKTNNNCY